MPHPYAIFKVMLLLALVVPILISLLWRPLSSNDVLQGARKVLLLTAHPDDECLFFAPTLLSLPAQVQVYSLCLSAGDAEGLGQIRREELQLSLDVLGIEKDKRWVVDSPNLQDNITAIWEPEDIAKEINPYVTKHSIDSILTFDEQGVSSHPNHISLRHGVSHMLRSNRMSRPLRAYGLITVPLVTKYVGPVASLLAKLDIGFAYALERLGLAEHGVPVTVFVSGMTEYATALKAMTQHRSQLVWFRWLNVAFSRYMWVNEWVEIAPRVLEGV